MHAQLMNAITDALSALTKYIKIKTAILVEESNASSGDTPPAG